MKSNSLNIVIIMVISILACSKPRTEGHLVVSFRTHSYGGAYAPSNIGAVWLEDMHGQFIKTLECWASIQKKHLVRWNRTTDSSVVDAITSATYNQHDLHEASWDGTHEGGGVVEDGKYRICIEFTEDNSAYNGSWESKFFYMEFHKGNRTVRVFKEDHFFRAVELEYFAFQPW